MRVKAGLEPRGFGIGYSFVKGTGGVPREEPIYRQRGVADYAVVVIVHVACIVAYCVR